MHPGTCRSGILCKINLQGKKGIYPLEWYQGMHQHHALFDLFFNSIKKVWDALPSLS